MIDETKELIKDIETDIFAKDCFKRKDFVVNISRILKNSLGEEVFSLEGEFGYGKTVLCHRLKSYINTKYREEAHCVYLNMWESDFYNSPLIPIVDEITNSFKVRVGINKALRQMKKDALKFVKGGSWQIIKILANTKFPGSGNFIEKVKSYFVSVSKEIEKSELIFNDYRNLKGVKSNFIENLEKLANNKKLIIIIDELDRCRPDYAIQTLEIMKHFFEAENVIFLLSINMKQLKNSVKCIYGLEGDNFDNYMRKFSNSSFKLPKPNNESFAEYLYEKSSIKKMIDFEKIKSVIFSNLNNQDKKDISGNIKRNFMRLSDYYNTPPRVQEQIFSKLETFVKSLDVEDVFLPEFHIPLLYMNECNEKDYDDKSSNFTKVENIKLKYYCNSSYDGRMTNVFVFDAIKKVLKIFTELNNNINSDFYSYNIHALNDIKNDILTAYDKIELVNSITSNKNDEAA